MNEKKQSNKKTFISIAFALLMVLSIIFLFSLFRPTSSLDISIVEQFVYDIDPTYPAVVGLSVDLYNDHLTPIDTQITDINGYVTFTNLADGTYTNEWLWGGQTFTYEKKIDCSQIVWDFGQKTLESKVTEDKSYLPEG